MKKPENTTSHEAKIALLTETLIAGNTSGLIERQETEGQRQLVHGDVLPVKTSSAYGGPSDAECDAIYEAMGFKFGEPLAEDPIFRPATLPNGWRRVGSDHAMWSYIEDENGEQRVAIFYKAAFYDRDSFMRIVSEATRAERHASKDV